MVQDRDTKERFDRLLAKVGILLKLARIFRGVMQHDGLFCAKDIVNNR